MHRLMFLAALGLALALLVPAAQAQTAPESTGKTYPVSLSSSSLMLDEITALVQGDPLLKDGVVSMVSLQSQRTVLVMLRDEALATHLRQVYDDASQTKARQASTQAQTAPPAPSLHGYALVIPLLNIPAAETATRFARADTPGGQAGDLSRFLPEGVTALYAVSENSLLAVADSQTTLDKLNAFLTLLDRPSSQATFTVQVVAMTSAALLRGNNASSFGDQGFSEQQPLINVLVPSPNDLTYSADKNSTKVIAALAMTFGGKSRGYLDLDTANLPSLHGLLLEDLLVHPDGSVTFAYRPVISTEATPTDAAALAASRMLVKNGESIWLGIIDRQPQDADDYLTVAALLLTVKAEIVEGDAAALPPLF